MVRKNPVRNCTNTENCCKMLAEQVKTSSVTLKAEEKPKRKLDSGLMFSLAYILMLKEGGHTKCKQPKYAFLNFCRFN